MKRFSILLIVILCLLFSACGTDIESQNSSSVQETYNNLGNSPAEIDPQAEDVTPQHLYFESDETVDKFFTDYNSIAEVPIPAEEIEKGNIRTKALVYIDDLSLEIINATDFLSISMSSSVENEATTLYAVFRDTIKATNPNVTDEEIQSIWNTIHESGYLAEGYNFDNIIVKYIPSKELSWGTSDLRIDLEIPLK